MFSGGETCLISLGIQHSRVLLTCTRVFLTCTMSFRRAKLPFCLRHGDQADTLIWDQVCLSNRNEVPPPDKGEAGAMWDQFLHNSKLAFDSVEKNSGTKKQS
eukprot:c24446_g1_i4 orf=75-380(+)